MYITAKIELDTPTIARVRPRKIKRWSNFTLRGWTEDASAQAFAQIVDPNGDTNAVTGIVERDGKIWAQNLPLASGTNYLTLIVTNAAGLSSETNIVIVKSALNMSINPVTGDLRLPTTTVSGTISAPADYTVWVNGVKATVTGNNWEADNVSLPAGGGVTAIQVRAIPNADNGGNGTGVGGGGPVTFDNLGNPGQDDDMEPGALPRQTGVVVDSAVWGYNTVWYYPLTASYELTQEDGLYEPTQEEDHVTGNYSFAKGGKVTEDWKACFIDGTDDTKTVWVLAPGGAVTNCNGVTVTNGSLPAGVGYGLENGKLSGKYWPNPDCIVTQDKNSTVKMTFYAGGFGVPGQQVLVAVNLPSQAQQEVTQPGFASGGPKIPYEQTSIPGLGKNLGTDGWAYGEKDNGTLVDVTPTAGAPMYNFPWPNASAYALSIQANYIDLTESAVLGLVPEFCVGQKVTFVTAWNGSTSPMYAPPNVVWPNTIYIWVLSSTFVNRDTPGTSWASDTWDIDPASSNSASPFGYWTTGGGKNVNLKEALHFSNGQSVTLNAGGYFKIFRPTPSIVVKDLKGQPKVIWTGLRTIGVGTQVSYPNSMSYEAGINTANGNFGGYGKFVQIIDSYDCTGTIKVDGVSQDDPKVSNALDNQDPYKLDNWPVYANTTPWWHTGSAGMNNVPLDDAPNGGSKFLEEIRLKTHFTDYLMFKPTGDDSIWVTIGKVSWATHSYVPAWSYTITPDDKVDDVDTFDGSDAFPSWSHVISNH
jgi:hypothetical protein